MYSLPDWTLKEIAAFVLTTRLGTVTAAAQSLGMSQSATSRLIAGLESKLGYALFDRVGRGVVPSTAGQEFLERAKAILRAAEPSDDGALEAGQRLLRVVAPPSFCTGFVQEVVAVFLRENPGFTVQLEVRNTPALVEMVSESRFDIGLTSGLRMDHPVRAVPLKKVEIACLMPRDHPLATQAVIAPGMLDGFSLVLLSHRHPSRAFVDGILDRHAIRMERRVETSTGISALHLARFTNAVAIMSPFPISNYLPGDMVAIPFQAEFEYSYSVVLPLGKGTPPHVGRFLKLLQRAADRGM